MAFENIGRMFCDTEQCNLFVFASVDIKIIDNKIISDYYIPFGWRVINEKRIF